MLPYVCHAGTCTNFHALDLEGVQNTTLQGINTCDSEDSNGGFLQNLQGKDYVVLLEAGAHARSITVTTSESEAGFEYDTFLVVATHCTSNQTLDTVVRLHWGALAEARAANA